MRIFLAGATGVIGIRLVPLLVAAGHDVAAMTRSPEKADALRALGATPVVCDVYDRDALREAVVSFGPDLVLHELTDLPDEAARLPDYAAANARIRREGTRNLLAAATAAGSARFAAESVAWTIPGDGGEAVTELEQSVLEAGGVVLRYGAFYGPGTYHANDVPAHPRIHVDAAAARTLEALQAGSGIVEIVE